jgi:hypothetical protein
MSVGKHDVLLFPFSLRLGFATGGSRGTPSQPKESLEKRPLAAASAVWIHGVTRRLSTVRAARYARTAAGGTDRRGCEMRAAAKVTALRRAARQRSNHAIDTGSDPIGSIRARSHALNPVEPVFLREIPEWIFDLRG